jgi:hypothetical protein
VRLTPSSRQPPLVYAVIIVVRSWSYPLEGIKGVSKVLKHADFELTPHIVRIVLTTRLQGLALPQDSSAVTSASLRWIGHSDG